MTLMVCPTEHRGTAPPLPTATDGVRYRIERVDAAGLESRRAEWEILVANAQTANVFYEPWMLLPGIEAFDRDRSFQALLVHRQHGAASELTGFFPCESMTRTRGMPMSRLRLWSHAHSLLSAPLLHKGHASESWHAALDDARRGGVHLLELPLIDAEGPFGQVLTEVVNDRLATHVIEEQFNRAIFRKRGNAEEYLAAAVPNSRHRQEHRRQRRRLEDLGAVETRVLGARDEVGPWLNAFFQLEASGWKGAEKTALALDPREKSYFANVVAAGHRRGQLQMLGLFLAGEPIAMKCNFLTGDGGFTLKIAFDERYAKFSPGVLLELEMIRVLHQMPSVNWLDSCAIAKHPMIDRLWIDRRAIQHRVVSTGSRRGDIFLGLMSLGRAVKRGLWRKGKKP